MGEVRSTNIMIPQTFLSPNAPTQGALSGNDDQASVVIRQSVTVPHDITVSSSNMKIADRTLSAEEPMHSYRSNTGTLTMLGRAGLR